ncbi:hypothetical protein L2E82_48410 [Cichorium intybus]|uniref:Uncharacterized protein n=1 Tax=Cichorium intybus TaxID=13427 RepID=A0ACB8YZ56_CICIN|nr:hypothetical protein L2E82_48410 [Cichorium intybus]
MVIVSSREVASMRDVVVMRCLDGSQWSCGSVKFRSREREKEVEVQIAGAVDMAVLKVEDQKARIIWSKLEDLRDENTTIKAQRVLLCTNSC